MTDRQARRLALTLTGFLHGHRNRCDRKPEYEVPYELKHDIAREWHFNIRTLTTAELPTWNAQGVDYVVQFKGLLFGIYEEGGSRIPAAKPSVADHYICIGDGGCPTWVYKFYGLYPLPVAMWGKDPDADPLPDPEDKKPRKTKRVKPHPDEEEPYTTVTRW